MDYVVAIFFMALFIFLVVVVWTLACDSIKIALKKKQEKKALKEANKALYNYKWWHY